MLAITVGTVSPAAYLSIYIMSSVGITLPEDSSKFIASDFRIFSNAVEGTVPPTEPTYVTSFGNLNISELFYNPAQAGQISEIKLQFSMISDLIQNDSVVLTLAGFATNSSQISNTSCSQYVSLIKDQLFDVWCLSDQDTTVRLVLQSQLIPAGDVVELRISSRAGIHLPPRGLQWNQSTLTLSSTAVFGPFPARPISRSPSVGSLVYSALVFDHGQADKSSTMHLSLKFSMQLTKRDCIQIFLPSFRSVQSIKNITFYASGGILQAVVWNQSSSLLIFYIETPLPPYFYLNVTIPSESSIRLPKNGIRGWKSGITVSTNAFYGPIPNYPPCALQNIESVGAFVSSAISFLPPSYAGEASTIKIAISTSMGLSAGDSIGLILPHFSINTLTPSDQRIMENITEIDTVILSEPASMVQKALWNSSSNSLIFILQGFIEADVGTVFYVPSVAGITLPQEGLTENQSALLIWAECSDGSVLPTPIMSSPMVPRVALPISSSRVFRTIPQIHFSPMLPGNATMITISFMLSSDVKSGTKFIVNIPDFQGKNGTTFEAGGFAGLYRNELVCDEICSNSSVMNNSCFNISQWTTESVCSKTCHSIQRLEFICPNLRYSSYFEVIVPKDAMITLPEYGLSSNETKITCTLLNESSSVSSNGIGAFLKLPSLSFSPDILGSKTAINISFSSSLSIFEFDSIRLFVPFIFGGAFTDYIIFSDSITKVPLRAKWDPGSNELIFVLAQGSRIPSCREVVLYLPSAAGLMLPVNGIKPGSSGTISIYSKNGAIEFQSFPLYPIGKLITFLSFGANQPDTVSSMVFRFLSYNMIARNESIILILKDFSGSNIQCAPVVSEPVGVITYTNWSEVQHELSFKFNDDLAAMKEIIVNIPSHVGLRIPKQGLQSNDTNLEVKCDSKDIAYPETPLTGSSAVLINFQGNISFSDMTPGSNPEVYVSFVPYSVLNPNDTVSLILNGFSGQTNSFEVESSGSYLFHVKNSSLPSNYTCVPCSNAFRGYYAGLCGLSGIELRVSCYVNDHMCSFA